MIRVPRLRLLAASVLLGIACAGRALADELVLEVMQLRYRTAEQVLPVIQPLVPRPGTVSGMNNNLIVRTTPANLAEIRRVLDAVDRMPRRLMVSVRQDADARSTSDETEVSVTVGGDNARVTVPGSRDPRGAVVRGGSGEDRVQARVYSTQSLDNDRTTQQVQVLEGAEAFIQVGQSVPVPSATSRTFYGGRWVERSVDAVEYRDILTGFYVRPHVTGNVVTLEVSPQRDTPGDRGRGSMNVQRVSTTVSGQLGEWLEIGAIVSGRSFEASGNVYRSARARGDNRRVLIKVDELR